MIRVSIIYNKVGDSTFDYDYYVSSHMPLAKEKLNPVKAEVDKIVGTPDQSPSPIHCVGYLYFNSMDDMQKAMAAGAEPVMADIPNYYSGGAPVIIISEIHEG
ncbi:MAG: EthD family reductase [Chloroflexi bacterium]|nr:EthD family reductase [Chloroflexota bacterium]